MDHSSLVELALLQLDHDLVRKGDMVRAGQFVGHAALDDVAVVAVIKVSVVQVSVVSAET